MSNSTDNMESICFHCGEPLAGSTLCARIDGSTHAVCCIGCLAAAEWIDAAGLRDFYRYRQGSSIRPVQAEVSQDDRWSAYERPEIANRFVRRRNDLAAVNLIVDGVRCSACSWLIDKSLRSITGIRDVQVNAATGRACIQWSANANSLPDVLRLLANLGFNPHPICGDVVTQVQQEERRAALKRLAVATFGMMQVMMFAVAGYAADINHEVIDPNLAQYFRLISLLVATPVVVYAAQPFFRNAVRALRLKTVGVDVPVSAALLLAFIASVWNSLRGFGEVYFDSITMFVFFLTAGRFVEMSVRHRTNSVADALARHLPAMAHRISGEKIETVALVSLVVGDVILVHAGDVVPVDGVIIEGTTYLDESLLTGESLTISRSVGESVAGGAMNLRAPIRIQVTAIGEQTVIASVAALMQRAQAQKPAMAQMTEAASARFVRYVLLGSLAVCAAWMIVDPSRAFAATLAVLVVACPCAFSIATPATFAAATAQLARLGVLVVRVDSIEALAKLRRCVFDKTGTLTQGDVRISRATFYGGKSESEILAIAAALEKCSDHPIARAFLEHRTAYHVDKIDIVRGLGIEGSINCRRYRIGTLSFVSQICAGGLPLDIAEQSAPSMIALASERELLATFVLNDSLRDGAKEIAWQLESLGIHCEILSGDSESAVAAVASACSIGESLSRCLPADKVEHIRRRMQSELVLMVGDGINDAPVLGAASVSIAMGKGAALAHASADMILINERLHALPAAIAVARRAVEIVKQNLFWAAAYNLSALPLAALGYVPPWIAAIGMSMSSVAVILNALRLAPRSKYSYQPFGRRNQFRQSTLESNGAIL